MDRVESSHFHCPGWGTGCRGGGEDLELLEGALTPMPALGPPPWPDPRDSALTQACSLPPTQGLSLPATKSGALCEAGAGLCWAEGEEVLWLPGNLLSWHLLLLVTRAMCLMQR